MNLDLVSRLLCYKTRQNQWVKSDYHLQVKRTGAAACFTQTALYIFGGMMCDAEETLVYTSVIEQVLIEGLTRTHG